MKSALAAIALPPIVLIAACTTAIPSSVASAPVGSRGSSPAPVQAASASPAAPATPVAHLSLAAAKGCPTTKGSPGPKDIPGGAFFGWGSSYSNGFLWVGGLWPDGVIAADSRIVASDGSISTKFGWWRKASGSLEITGVRLDSPAPPAQSDVASGYGDTGFQPSGVGFPTEGCWAITGRVGSSTVSFVTFVFEPAR